MRSVGQKPACPASPRGITGESEERVHEVVEGLGAFCHLQELRYLRFIAHRSIVGY